MSNPVDRLPVIFGVLAAVVALLVLFVPRPIGLADNGDEGRLPCHLGLIPNYVWGQTQYMNSANFRWKPGAPPDGLNCGARSSAIVPLRVAAAMSRLLPGRPALDTRVAGVLQSLSFGVAIGLIVAGLPRRRRLRVVGGILLVAVCSDVAYLTYFSTAYAEPTGFVAFLATVGLIMIGWRPDGRRGPLWVGATVLAASTVVIAKPQYAALAVVFAVAIGLAHRSAARRSLTRALALGGAALVLVVGVVSIRSNPSQFRRINLYNAYFTELLGHSPDPAADLAEFGLPPSWRKLAGTNYFDRPRTVQSKAFSRFYDDVGYGTLTRFYAEHPSRTLHLVARGLLDGADPRVPYLGMFPYSRAHPERERTCRWCPISALGRLARPLTPVGGPLLWIGAVSVAVVELRGRRSSGPQRRGPVRDPELAVGILVTAASSLLLFATSVIGDGVEITKHLYLAQGAFVLMSVLTIVTVADRIAEQRIRRLEADSTS